MNLIAHAATREAQRIEEANKLSHHRISFQTASWSRRGEAGDMLWGSGSTEAMQHHSKLQILLAKAISQKRLQSAIFGFEGGQFIN